MIISAINFAIIAVFISIAHAAPLTGISSAFAVFWLNRKHGDDAKPTLRSKLYLLLAMPSIIMLIIYLTIPILVKLEIGILATSSVKDMAYFFTSFIAGIILSIAILRTGVQVF
ncbi:MAG: hypothetical protein Q8K61_08795 [Gallionella sp.]|nr:hypothetical protein [Gallionella sp.]